MRKLDQDPLLNPRMRRHLKALGLSNTSEYREWCKKAGLSPVLNKRYNDLKRELQIASSVTKKGKTQAALFQHIETLGLTTIKEYQKWCRDVGVGTSLHKSDDQREKEKKMLRRQQSDASLTQARRQKRNMSEAISEIRSGNVTDDDLTNPIMRLVNRHLKNSDMQEECKKAYIRLLVLPKISFFDVNPVIGQFGQRSGNTYTDALCALAFHYSHWIRTPESWTAKHHGLRAQFSELARHLFAYYPTPQFMDCVWFAGVSEPAQKQQLWFVHIASGKNIRTADLPLNCSKRMAHLFVSAPDNFTVIQALRWSQIIALGGGNQLADAVLQTRMGESFECEEFWRTLVHFFVNNPMLDVSCIGPIVDYVNNQKYVSRGQEGPLQPDFSMKGRQPGPLLLLVDTWHNALAKQKKKGDKQWPSSGIPGYSTAAENEKNELEWTIRELSSQAEIIEEGRIMKHCVASYVPSCYAGKKSIWSVRAHNIETGAVQHVLTVAVKNDVRRIVETRGKCNALPGVHPVNRQMTQVLKTDEDLLKKGRRILHDWASENEMLGARSYIYEESQVIYAAS